MTKAEELANPNSCLNKAKDDEMLFILRAKDVCAPFAIAEWIRKRIEIRMNRWTDPKIQEANRCVDTMVSQQKDLK